MAKYKKDSFKRLAKDTNYHIPWAEPEDVHEPTQNVTVVQFEAGSDYGFIKRELRKVLIALGCNRNEAKTATKKLFPELFL